MKYSRTVHIEDDFDLIKYLNFGGLPSVYTSKKPQKELKSYVSLYIKEEIQEEALVRKIDHFARFLDVFSFNSGKELFFKNIASDSSVLVKTVSSFRAFWSCF